jgi:hypothetical protein
MLSYSVERIEELGARRARKILAWCAWEHHVVDEQGVFPGLEEVGKSHGFRCAKGSLALERVVLSDHTA